MIEIFILILLFGIQTFHKNGFSHKKQKNWKSLYVLSESEGLELYVDGNTTGLKAPCCIYVEPSKSFVRLELRKKGVLFSQRIVDFNEDKTFVVMDAQPQLQLLPTINKKATV